MCYGEYKKDDTSFFGSFSTSDPEILAKEFKKSISKIFENFKVETVQANGEDLISESSHKENLTNIQLLLECPKDKLKQISTKISRKQVYDNVLIDEVGD